MFYGKENNYTIASPQYSKDEYKKTITTYRDEGLAKIHIVVQDRSMINNNELMIYGTTLVGYTRDMRIDKGWKIDDRYIVKSTVPHRMYSILYLQENENGR